MTKPFAAVAHIRYSRSNNLRETPTNCLPLRHGGTLATSKIDAPDWSVKKLRATVRYADTKSYACIAGGAALQGRPFFMHNYSSE